MQLKASNIHKSFNQIKVLKGVSLELEPGEIVSIVGASGAGKSTLLHILGTLENAESGEVWIGDTNVSKLKPEQLAKFRNSSIGFVFQFHQLLPEFTALENVCIPALIKGDSKSTASAKAKELLSQLKLHHRIDHKPSELSGGEQQRVAIARALINEPSIILADEPSGNLDSENAEDLHNLFFELRDKLHITFVIVTHNELLANRADRKLQIRDGLLV